LGTTAIRSPASAGRSFGSLDQQLRELRCRQAGDILQARLAVDAQTEAYLAVRDGEQRRVRAWEGAAGERQATREGAGVGEQSEALDLVDVEATLGRHAEHLEHDKTGGDAAPLGRLGGRRRRDVVGDDELAGVDPSACSRSPAIPKFMTAPA
jgi:hypothetical protein